MRNLLYTLLVFIICSCSAKKNISKHKYDNISIGKAQPTNKKMAKPSYDGDKSGEPMAEFRIVPRPEPKPEPIPEMLNEPHGTALDEPLRNRGTTARLALVTQPTRSVQSFEFTKGDINFVVKDTMVVGVITEVNMTISKDVDVKRIISEVNSFNDNNLHSDSIRIAPVMRASLVDPSKGINFIISPKTNAEQFIEANDYTLWSWDVTPLNKGNNKLSIIVDVMYGEKSKSYQVYDGLIYVYSSESFFDKLLSFFINNWQYLLSTLLLPFIYFIYTLFKKKK